MHYLPIWVKMSAGWVNKSTFFADVGENFCIFDTAGHKSLNVARTAQELAAKVLSICLTRGIKLLSSRLFGPW